MKQAIWKKKIVYKINGWLFLFYNKLSYSKILIRILNGKAKIQNDPSPPTHNITNQIHCLSFGRALSQDDEHSIHFFMTAFSTKYVITITSIK